MIKGNCQIKILFIQVYFTVQRKQFFSIMKTNRLILFREVISTNFETGKKETFKYSVVILQQVACVLASGL